MHGFSTWRRYGGAKTSPRNSDTKRLFVPFHMKSLSKLCSTFESHSLYLELKAPSSPPTACITPQQYLRALEEVQLDGRRPSELLRHMQQINKKAVTPFSDDVLKGRHARLLPIHNQLHLQTQPDLPLQEYGKLADVLMTTYTNGANMWPAQDTTASIATPPMPNNPTQQQPLQQHQPLPTHLPYYSTLIHHQHHTTPFQSQHLHHSNNTTQTCIHYRTTRFLSTTITDT
ncbi:hypothetical protein Pmani_008369 [Petrolisthes manimaculis]|uniref:Uncharacterized protein n=1 Tax=Petrolisthes manimaculis TaxID=1843537 RepID=A0AAE1UJP4_9EUCA|nr:hypothetical protein Pmani_008369 [Petrolisthes manimaculis]